ncbi:MAG: hypothetical protein ACT4OK_01150 [Gemmobacter sp.]
MDYETAPILLFAGRHIGPNRGYGAQHIWAEHAAEMARYGFRSADKVPDYVAKLVRAGTPLYFEGASFRRTRLLAVRTAEGTTILEYLDRRDGPIWSVVTAFSGTKTHGTRVGTVR